MSLRSLIETESVTVYNPTITSDNSGGPKQSGSNTTIDTGGMRIEVATSSQVEAYAQRNIVTTHLGFTFLTSIRTGHFITDSAGINYRVTGVAPMKTMGRIPGFTTVSLEHVQESGG